MARFKLAAGKELSDLGNAVYELAKIKLSGGDLQAGENAVRSNVVNGGDAVFCYDEAKKLHIVVPDLSSFQPDPGEEGKNGRSKFGNEALGFVTVFGCGP